MRYFIVDDDAAIRAMLKEIIEDEDFGEIVGEAENGSGVTEDSLILGKVDILIIDLLMPIRDGIETIKTIGSSFPGKIVMLSQVESKDLIGEAYALGVEYYISKPLNRVEFVNILKRVNSHLLLERSVQDIKRSLNVLAGVEPSGHKKPYKEKSISSSGTFLLSELSMLGEAGSKDLLSMLEYLYCLEKEAGSSFSFPSLKEIFQNIAQQKMINTPHSDHVKEIKASEQRIRRAIYQSLVHISSLGLTDYSNPTFERYASKFFDFNEVRKKMSELESATDPGMSNSKINTKKFVQVLYWEAKQLMSQP